MLQLTRIVSIVAAVVLAASCSDMPSNPARGTTMAPLEGLTPSLMTSGACQTAPTLISEEFLPDGRVRFKWDQQDNLCRLHHWFELRVDATDAVVESGEPYVILNNGLFEYTRGAGLSGIMYKWRVRNAYSDLIWGPYSPYRLFTPPAPTTVTVSPSSATMCPTGNLGVTATVTDQNGGVWTGGTVAWSSSNTSVATATSNGSRTANVAATGNGTATITATLDGVSGPSTVTVGACLAPPTSCTLDYIPYPHYLHVQWVNGDASASTEVWIMQDAGSWQLIKTASPGTTDEFHVVGPGLWDARVRHVKSGYPPSAYCNTNGKTVP